MKDHLTRLTEKTSTLGNYNYKYLHIISSTIDELNAALEQQGVRDKVHFWNYSMEIPGEMDTVLQAASHTQQKLDFLGCYYALQFLHMNLRLIDIVKLEQATGPERGLISKKFMLEAGRMFRYLTKSYMQRLLNIFLEGMEFPEFVMLGVGTRSDQDDIDLGIVHKGTKDPGPLNHAIGQMASQMFKTATRLHFHLSEHIGDKSLTATIEEYELALDHNRYDFIMVNEMLGAATILGNYSLYEEFRNRVTDRFYYDARKKNNLFHEGYLRGILGEIRSIRARPKPPHIINPKEDGLRPIKGVLSALKIVHGIKKVNAWHIIDELKEKNPQRLSQYKHLERTLSFFEMFRHLYQIMVAQDEEVMLYEPAIEAMVARIARMIGFEKKGVVSAKDFMLVYYYEYLENSTEAIRVLIGDLTKHLRNVSIYGPIFSGDIHKKPGYEGNLAVDFIQASSFSEGIVYWDDFLEELEDEEKPFYDEFVESFQELADRLMSRVAWGYVAGTKFDPTPILRFLTILGKRAVGTKARDLFLMLCGLFMDELDNLPSASASLSQISGTYADTLNNFLALLDWELLDRFMSIIRKKPDLPEFIPYHEELLALARVHHQGSHFFKRHFHPILNKYPVFIRNLPHPERLREISTGFYSDLTSLTTLDTRLERLGDYYDMEFVRVSLLALSGASSEQTDAEFIEFCDNYTHSLYEFCLEDVHLSLGYSLHTHDLFALYATGGHAREQGFDDDYDMIVILDSSDQEQLDYCNKIVAKMNSHILKRSILPHHRFADHFGRYVVSFDQLVEYLGSKGEGVIVDLSQILCSRMLVGTSRFEVKLQQQIIDPYIFNRDRQYIDYIIEDSRLRHAGEEGEQRNNIKECRGGQRDIEMLLMIYKTRHKLRDPLSRKLLRRLAEIDTRHREDFAFITDHMNFIRNLRNLYRLKVAAHDVIEAEHLPGVAASMGYGSDPEAARKLYEDFHRRTERASKVLEKLTANIWS